MQMFLKALIILSPIFVTVCLAESPAPLAPLVTTAVTTAMPAPTSSPSTPFMDECWEWAMAACNYSMELWACFLGQQLNPSPEPNCQIPQGTYSFRVGSPGSGENAVRMPNGCNAQAIWDRIYDCT